mmetsp:Transcript_3623/g.7941  ORF Transcript_3623/g.7941 Transcript_3623/m.7941 type:complete len:323 (-) Transcript_3623:2029-2997(-)
MKRTEPHVLSPSSTLLLFPLLRLWLHIVRLRAVLRKRRVASEPRVNHHNTHHSTTTTTIQLQLLPTRPLRVPQIRPGALHLPIPIKHTLHALIHRVTEQALRTVTNIKQHLAIHREHLHIPRPAILLVIVSPILCHALLLGQIRHGERAQLDSAPHHAQLENIILLAPAPQMIRVAVRTPHSALRDEDVAAEKARKAGVMRVHVVRRELVQVDVVLRERVRDFVADWEQVDVVERGVVTPKLPERGDRAQVEKPPAVEAERVVRLVHHNPHVLDVLAQQKRLQMRHKLLKRRPHVPKRHHHAQLMRSHSFLSFRAHVSTLRS